jgi:hypothetical protein
MNVHSFDVLDGDDLVSLIDHLRSADVEWPQDVLLRLAEERSDAW